MNNQLNTRIAPSPTGYFHVGTARTAYFNYLAARATNGQFILRIDDTDNNRNNHEFIDQIYKSMNWLNLDYDLTFKQSDQLSHYYQAAELLLKEGLAIYKDGAIILQVEKYQLLPINFKDEIAGEINISNQDYKNSSELVLIKQDKMPTYHYASVIDDINHQINCVIRGVDHLNNTPKQIAIINALNKVGVLSKIPQYYHLGLLCVKNKKISKRAGQEFASLNWYQEKNYQAAALLNWLLRMGWGPTVDDKSNSVIDPSKAIKMFLTEGKMRSSPANLDFAKLDWFNKKYQINLNQNKIV
mgnify:CR=1 FL=1